ncbi:MAG: trigger factor [Candidatus Paceibacterota bacterium]|jgi:FKBP-type peptidyl-prolyl cis-trans isomerase (trigger factor)
MHTIKSFEKKEGSVIEMVVEIEAAAVEAKWSQAAKHIGEHAKLDGFRPGHVPEKILVDKVGEMTILEEAAELTINEVYTKIVIEKNLKILGHPKVVITKIARNAPLEVTIRTAVVPEIKLPDYKKIAAKSASKKDDLEVTDKDVEAVFDELKAHRKKAENIEDPVIDDEFAAKLGDFKSADELKAKVRENLKHEKEYKARESKRIEILEAIRKDADIDVPELLIENELERMTNEFSHKLGQMGATLEQYKKDTGKTEESLREEWKEKAKERSKNELILLEIARAEKLVPKKEDIEHEAKHMIEHYPGTPEDRVYGFVEEVLTKEEVFKFLETQGK